MSQPQSDVTSIMYEDKSYNRTDVNAAVIIGVIFGSIIIIILYVVLFWVVRFLFTGLTGSRRVGNIAGTLAIVTLIIITIASNMNRAHRAKENCDLRELLYSS